MKHVAPVCLGLLLTLGTSWWGLVVIPQRQLGALQPWAVPGSVLTYPSPRPDLAARGQEVYRANGCFHCHTQQVQATGLAPEFQTTNATVRYLGPDFDRGWGQRVSVARDYLRDQPVMIGALRVGPDLANLGVRRPKDELQANLLWHLRHLYDPPSVAEGSTMPAHRFLFAKRRLKPGQSVSLNEFGWADADPRFEIVPKPEAVALASYLFSLEMDAPLDEAPLSTPPEATTGSSAAAPVPGGPAP